MEVKKDAALQVKCPSCAAHTEDADRYCRACGQQLHRPRITLRFLLLDAWQALTNLERGFLPTCRELLLRPGAMLRAYWGGASSYYQSPLRFVFIALTISVLTYLLAGMEESMQSLGVMEVAQDGQRVGKLEERFSNQLIDFLMSYLNLLTLLMLPFVSFFTWLFFFRKGANYAEHLTANAYYLGMGSLLALVVLPLSLIFPQGPQQVMLYALGSALIGNLYNVYAFKLLFGVSWWSAFWKSTTALALGYVLFMFLLFFILGLYMTYVIDPEVILTE